jgi:hypothetical protein
MKGELGELAELLNGDPTRVLDPAIKPTDPDQVIASLSDIAARSIAGLSLTANSLEEAGRTTEYHEQVADALGELFSRLNQIGMNSGMVALRIEDFVTTRVKACPRVVDGILKVKEEPVGRAEWRAYEEYGRPEVVAKARDQLTWRLKEFDYSGDDFDVVRMGEEFNLVFSRSESAIFLGANKQPGFVQSTAGAIDFKNTKLFLRVNKLDLDGQEIIGEEINLLSKTGERIYRALIESAPDDHQIDRPGSSSVTLVTDPLAVSSTSNKGYIMRTNNEGKFIKAMVSYRIPDRTYGLRMVFPLPT